MRKIDIVEIRQQIKNGIIIPYIEQDNVYLSNKAGEVICIGKVDELRKDGGGA